MRAFFSHGPWTKFAGHRLANPSRGISPDTVWRIAAGRSRRRHPRLQTAGCALSIAVVGLRAPAAGASDRPPVARTACAVAQPGRAAEEGRRPATRRCAHTRRGDPRSAHARIPRTEGRAFGVGPGDVASTTAATTINHPAGHTAPSQKRAMRTSASFGTAMPDAVAASRYNDV